MAAAVFTAVSIEGMRPSAPLGVFKMTLKGPTSYPTGGITGAAALIQAAAAAAGYNFSITKSNVFGVIPVDCKGYQIAYDDSNDTVIWYYNDNNNASDGPAIEVPNATDLTGVTVKFSVVIA